MVDVRIAAWHSAYHGLMPATFLAAMAADRQAAIARLAAQLATPPYPCLVGLDDGGMVVGMCAYGPGRDDELPAAGELYAINVQPRAWGAGVGSALFAMAERGLAGYPAAYLWVVEGNTRARRFYERSGWRPDGAGKIDDRLGTGVTEVRYLRDLPGRAMD